MPSFRTLAILVAIVANAWGQPYPSDLFRPEVSRMDTVSIRKSVPGDPTQSIREDVFASSKDSRGRPGRVVQVYREAGDSLVTDLEWNLPFRVVGQAPIASCSRVDRRSFHLGVLTSESDESFAWDSTTRTLLGTKAKPDSGCTWSDSTVFDSLHRTILSKSCSITLVYQAGGSSHRVDRGLFRAWYEEAADTLPRRSSLWTDLVSLDDSVASVGPANRPDTLVRTDREALVRDASGRVVQIRYVGRFDTLAFFYDRSGRLSQVVPAEGFQEEYLYNWLDVAAVRPRDGRTGEVRATLDGDRLFLDLPTAGELRVDAILPNGRRRAVFDGFRPAGAANLAVAVHGAEILRVRAPGITDLISVAK